MKGRAALVTGGSRGIGSAIAMELARAGAEVAVGYRAKEAEAEAVVRGIRELGGQSRSVQIDVRDVSSVDAALLRAGPFEIVVNNAGVSRDALFATMSDEDWSEVLRTNLDGAMHVCRAVLRKMISERRGVIVNVASLAGLAASPGQANYAASKAGLVGLTRTLAAEVGRYGIRVNAVVPGLIDAGMVKRTDRRRIEDRVQHTPLGRLGTAEEVARVVRFLASDEASFVTGQAWTVDGGLSV